MTNLFLKIYEDLKESVGTEKTLKMIFIGAGAGFTIMGLMLKPDKMQQIIIMNNLEGR